MVKDTANNNDLNKVVTVFDKDGNKITGILEAINTEEYGEEEYWYYVENFFKVNGVWYDRVEIEES